MHAHVCSYVFLLRIIEHQRPSIIDNIFINVNEEPIRGNIINRISDHFPNFILIKDKKSTIEVKTVHYKRNMKNYNHVTFTNDLQTSFAKTDHQNQNTNELSKNIINTFATSIDALAPMEKISKREVKNIQKPWLTQRILHSIKVKTKWLKKFLQSKNSTHYKTYKLYRDKLNSLIRASKRNHFQHYFNQHSQNSKKTWNAINKLLGKNRETLQDNLSLCINNKIISDQKQVADTLNKYFVGIGENLSANLPTATHTIDYYLDNPKKESFYTNPFTPEEVLALIKELDANKSMDISNQNQEMHKISEWLSTNKLTLNVDKSNYIIFSTRKKLKLYLMLNNEILQEKGHTKYLGVIIDNKLTWKNHITQIKLRLSKGIGILYKLRQIVSQSNSNYCILNWGNAAPTNLTQIKTSLNKALRVMCFNQSINQSIIFFFSLYNLYRIYIIIYSKSILYKKKYNNE